MDLSPEQFEKLWRASEKMEGPKKGKIDAVVATSRSGNLLLRTHRDVIVENNLDNLG